MLVVVYTSFLIFNSAVGAYISSLIAIKKASVYWAVMSSIFSGFIWGKMTQLNYQLSHMSILYDVTICLTYLFVFYILGDRLRPLQILGAALSIIGIILISSFQK